MMNNYERFTHLMFDCYGTLIDWERGILSAIRTVLQRHKLSVEDVRILRLYAQSEAIEEEGTYKTYRNVLRGVMSHFASEMEFIPTEADLDALPDSVGKWPPFPDTIEALQRLKASCKLVILSNIDDEMFRETEKLLQIEFDAVFTSQQIGSYKPSRDNFQFALERLGIPNGQLLHIAQSLYHDHVPAKELGLVTAWINRKSICPDTGVAPPAEAAPDIELPDLKSLADAMGL